MKYFRKYGVALLLTFILFCSGCIAPDFFLSGSTGSGKPIRIAAVLPLTGNNRIYAEQMREGLLMAAGELNDNSRNAVKAVQLRFFDSKGSLAGTVAALKDVKKWKAAGIIAGYNSEEVSNIISGAKNFRMPIVIPLATSNRHTELSSFVYRNSYTNIQQAQMIAAYLWYWRTVKFMGIFTGENDNTDYQADITSDTGKSFRNFGGSVTAVIPVKNVPADKEIVEMLKSEPEAILLTYGGKNAALTIKKLRNMGFTGIICGADNWDDEELLAHLDNFKVGDCLFTAFFNDDESVFEYSRFKSTFRKRFYHNPGARETQCFDALRFLVFSLRDTYTLPTFDSNWQKIRQYQGVAALYTMLPRRMIDRTIYIKSIGVRREGEKIKPFFRLSHKLQHSKLKEYNPANYQ